MGSIKLSVVIITYNEEKNIRRCLESVKEIADEIIVLDSYSTDNTQQICLEYGVKFYKQTFLGHIEQKNKAIEFSSNDIILSLDADEALSDQLRKSILEKKHNFTSDGYYFNRLTNYCGKWIKHGGWYPDRKLRLWNKNKGKWGGENPHDKFEMIENSKTEYINGDLLHYSYFSINQHIAQVNKFTDILSQSSFAKGKRAGLKEILFGPYWKFIKDYFIKAGFIDGYYGFVIAIISAHATFIKYIKLIELQKNDKNRKS